jgi:molybdate transport system substrate-binding protein
MRILAGAIAFALALSAAPQAGAAEVKVISAGSVRGLIGGMIQEYSRQTGHTFDFTVGTTGQLRNIIKSGQPADLIIVSQTLMAELEKTGKMTPGSRADLGRVGLGVAIGDNAPAPDLSTPEAFKAVLTNAKSIAMTDPKEGGTSVLALMKIVDRFGIKDAILAKAVLEKGGFQAAAAVKQGKAEMAVTFISEIISAKARLAGPLPAPLQDYTVYAAAIPASSTEPATAKAFIAALTSPAMAKRWTDAGFEPPK